MSKVPFENRIPEIKKEIDKRRSKWKFGMIPFEDISQTIFIRVYNKYHTFDDSKGEFSHWVNRLITRTIINIYRDGYLIYSRPCILGCVFNMGDSDCGYTKSGKQCEECPIYAKWAKKKQDQFFIQQPVHIDEHESELKNTTCDFVDFERSKEIIDDKLKNYLTEEEYEVYTLLFITNLEPEEAALALGYPPKDESKKADTFPGYSRLNKTRNKIIEYSKLIIEEEGLA